MWAYQYEIDKKTKEKTRKIIWIEVKTETPSIETEIKDSPISEGDNNLPLEEAKEEPGVKSKTRRGKKK